MQKKTNKHTYIPHIIIILIIFLLFCLFLFSQQNYDDFIAPYLAESRPNDHPLFIVNMDISRNGEIFNSMKLQTAPLILFLQPRSSLKQLKASNLHTSLSSRYKFPLQPKTHSQDIVTFIQKLSGQQININYAAVTMEEYVIGGLGIIVSVFCVYRYFDQILQLRNNPAIRLIICIVGWTLYMWCISGGNIIALFLVCHLFVLEFFSHLVLSLLFVGMYNIIKGNIFSHTEKDKPTEYISGEPRDQYGAEGLILGFLNMAAALMLLLVNSRAFDIDLFSLTRAPSKGGATSKANARASNSLAFLWEGISPYLTPALCIAGMTLFWLQIVAIYSMKNRGYNRGFVWY